MSPKSVEFDCVAMVKNSIVLTLAGATYPAPDTARVDDAKQNVHALLQTYHQNQQNYPLIGLL